MFFLSIFLREMKCKFIAIYIYIYIYQKKSFRDRICDTDLTHIQLISKCNKGINFYYMSLTFSVNMHGLLLSKKGITIINSLQILLD